MYKVRSRKRKIEKCNRTKKKCYLHAKTRLSTNVGATQAQPTAHESMAVATRASPSVATMGGTHTPSTTSLAHLALVVAWQHAHQFLLVSKIPMPNIPWISISRRVVLTFNKHLTPHLVLFLVLVFCELAKLSSRTWLLGRRVTSGFEYYEEFFKSLALIFSILQCL